MLCNTWYMSDTIKVSSFMLKNSTLLFLNIKTIMHHYYTYKWKQINNLMHLFEIHKIYTVFIKNIQIKKNIPWLQEQTELAYNWINLYKSKIKINSLRLLVGHLGSPCKVQTTNNEKIKTVTQNVISTVQKCNRNVKVDTCYQYTSIRLIRHAIT